MDFEQKKIMGEIDDPLSVIFKGTIGIFRYRFNRILLAISLILHWTKNVFQIYIFLLNPDELIQFMPFLFGEFYALATGTAILITRNTLEQFVNTEYKRWTMDSAGPEVEKQIKQWSRKQLMMVYSIFALGLIAGLLVLYPDPSDGEFIFLVYYVEKKYPGSRKWFPYLYKISMGPLGYTLSVHPLLLMYGAMHGFFQTTMVIEHIKNFTRYYVEDDEDDALLENEEFQEEVHRRLVFVIARHAELLEMLSKVNKRIVQPLFPVIAISGYCIGLSLVMFYLGVDNQLYAANIRNLSVGALFGSIVGVTFWGLISAGQLLENINEDILYTLQYFKWYVWNKKNKSALCLLVVGLGKPARLFLTDNVSINFLLGMQMLKGIYSLVSVLSMIQK